MAATATCTTILRLPLPALPMGRGPRRIQEQQRPPTMRLLLMLPYGPPQLQARLPAHVCAWLPRLLRLLAPRLPLPPPPLRWFPLPRWAPAMHDRACPRLLSPPHTDPPPHQAGDSGCLTCGCLWHGRVERGHGPQPCEPPATADAPRASPQARRHVGAPRVLARRVRGDGAPRLAAPLWQGELPRAPASARVSSRSSAFPSLLRRS